MEDLETRELRYFVAVAEELHFGRAAERLGIAQPPLSRAVRQLELRLGVQLLDRDRRGTALTAAGTVLLREARAALEAVAAAERRPRRRGDHAPPRRRPRRLRRRRPAHGGPGRAPARGPSAGRAGPAHAGGGPRRAGPADRPLAAARRDLPGRARAGGPHAVSAR